MVYSEVEEGQRVQIASGRPVKGTVHAKEIVTLGVEPHRFTTERVYVNTDRGGRSLCHPSVLTLIREAGHDEELDPFRGSDI